MLLDTGGGILHATRSFKKPFVAINPDTLWSDAYCNELKDLEDLYFKKKKPCLLLVNKNLSFDSYTTILGVLESLINIFGKGNFFFPNISFFFKSLVYIFTIIAYSEKRVFLTGQFRNGIIVNTRAYI